MTEVRTRFAPSPTGHLHLGGARTALFNWLYTRRHGGKFILRIDDTDRERSTREMELAIIEGMTWLGLDWDEGPFYQSKRTDLYDSAIERLLAAGHVYRCDCSPDELEKKRIAATAKGENPRYDGKCRNRNDVSPDSPHVLRFKTPNVGEIVIDDAIQGKIIFKNNELDDLIVRRTDGTVTYNFSTVVDDADLRVTHIIRGADHINNTPRQYHIYTALGATPPVFAHMPLTLGADKTKLSKRHGDTALLGYRDKGFLPEAMLNYMVRLGWSHGDAEIFTTTELKKIFDMDGCTKAPGVFDTTKLTWVNEQHMQRLDNADLGKRMIPFLKGVGIEVSENDARLAPIAASLKQRAKTLIDLAESAKFYFIAPTTFEEKAAKKFLGPDAAATLDLILKNLPADKITKDEAMKLVHELAEKSGAKMGAVAQPLRVALTGVSASPPIDDIMAILGVAECRARINKAIEFAKGSK